MTALPPRSNSRRKKQTSTIQNDAKSESKRISPRYCVIGGGIAGVCCAQELSRLHPNEIIVLISQTDVLREVTAIMKLTQNLEEFSVFERRTEQFCMDNKNIQVINASLESINYDKKTLYLSNKEIISFNVVCICTGSQPKTLFTTNHSNILTIRDIQSVQEITERLKTARKVCVIGNGGIAMELVTTLTFCDVNWTIKDNYIGSAFFDATASAFVAPDLIQRADANIPTSTNKRCIDKLSEDSESAMTGNDDDDDMNVEKSTITETEFRHHGSALGPEWISKSSLLTNIPTNIQSRKGSLNIQFGDEVISVEQNQVKDKNKDNDNTNSNEYPLKVYTKNGQIIECDFMISAVGVKPNTDFIKNINNDTKILNELDVDSDGGIIVNDCQQTSLSDIFAAGDCCTVKVADPFTTINNSDKSKSNQGILDHHWFQMKLWTQARTMGAYAGQCIYEYNHNKNSNSNSNINNNKNIKLIANNISFELFAHVTRFFGHKVVLLGRYNAQGLGVGYESRIKEMVVTDKGLVKGQMSIGEVATALAQGKYKAKSKSTSGTTTTTTTTTTTITTTTTANEENDDEDDGDDQMYCKDEENVSQLTSKQLSSSSAKLKDVEIWIRITPNEEYIKVVVFKGRVVGALLLGDTDCEEVFENLILNKIDVSDIGEAILDPDLDLEGYFD
jgi:pyridine nucleotide-disulfide oxidoreductase domain-containing protein 1